MHLIVNLPLHTGSQGLTLDKVFVDDLMSSGSGDRRLGHVKPQAYYVAMSRVCNASSFASIHPSTKDYYKYRPPLHVYQEMKRLTSLDSETRNRDREQR